MRRAKRARCGKGVGPYLAAATRSALGLLLLVAGFQLSAGTVGAHATYVRSDPPAGGQLVGPTRIRASFSEDVDPRFSELQIVDSALRRVDRRDTQPVTGDAKALTVGAPQLPDGTYTVLWKTLSAVDGHTIRGAYPLVVGEGDQTAVATVQEYAPGPLEVALRFLTFFGSILLTGLLLFHALVIIPASRVQRAILGPWHGRLRMVGTGVAGALIVVSVVALLNQVASAADVGMGEVIGGPLEQFLGTRNGQIWLVKSGILMLYALVLVAGPTRLRTPIGLVLAGGFLAGTSLTSHAAALARGSELLVAVDWLHQLGAAAWLGGLFGALLLIPITRSSAPTDRTALLGALVPRLSTLAMASVALLVGTGVFAALVQVGSREAFASVYGAALALKVLALLPMLALGALHLLFFTPRFVSAAAGLTRGAASGFPTLVQRFRFGVSLEVLLGLVILAATGVLTSAEPAREIFARQPRVLHLAAPADDLAVTLSIEPGRVGPNTFTAQIVGPNGAPDATIQRVQLRFTYLDQEFGRGATLAAPQSATTFTTTANNLSIAGRWHVEAVVRRLNREDSVADFVAAVGIPTGSDGGSAIPVPAISSPWAAVAVVLLCLALVAIPWVWRTPDLPRVRRPMFAAAFLLVAVAASAALVNAADFRPDLRTIKNPNPPGKASVARGERVYLDQACGLCHGDSGRGDGPLAAGLRPPPADLRIHMAAGHTDGELFDWVSNGVRGTAMRGFASELRQDEIWDVINYIRSFAVTDAVAPELRPCLGQLPTPAGG